MKLVVSYFSLFLLLACSQGEQEIIVLPKNYTGYVLIIYNQKSGFETKYSESKRIYEIPSNGIFKTQFKSNDGSSGLPEFYYESLSSKNKIAYKFNYKNIPLDTIVAHGGSTGTANKDLAGKERVEFEWYYIGNKQQIDTAIEKSEKLDIIKFAD